MRLPRFRVRTLMIVVGVVALLSWGAMLASRSYDFLQAGQGIRSPGSYGWALNRLEGTRPPEWKQFHSECVQYLRG